MLSTQPANPLSIARLEPAWAFATCWIIAAVVLYVAGSPPSGPTVFPDEVCRLGWARLLSGTGPHFEMSPGAYCQPYYPLLLAPLQWLTHDPAAIQRGVFAINTVFAAACLPLAVRLGIRHFGLGIETAWLAGIAILAYPSLTLYSHYALPETILFPAMLVTFGLWCNWVDRPNWRQFAHLLAMSVILYALHRKMLVVPLALMGGAIAGYWVDRSPEFRIRLLLTGLGLVGLFFLNALVRNVALSAHLQIGDVGVVDLLARQSSFEHLQHAAGKAAGLLVYATLTTGGCIWLVLGGGLDAIRLAILSGLGALDKLARKSAFAFGLVVLLGALTALAFGSGERFDTWFYGRHVDSALGVALLPTIAMIAKKRVNGAVLRWAVALPVITFMVLAIDIPGPPWKDFSPVHTVGAGKVVKWLHSTADRWTLLMYCAASLSIAGAMCLGTLMPGRLRYTALAPFAVAAAITHMTTQPFEGVPIEKAIPEPAAKVLRAAVPCHVHWDARNGGRIRQHQYFRLQYHFPNCSIEMVTLDQPVPPGSLVVVRRAYADCGPDTVCHDLHPDLVLYRTARK